MMKYIVLCVSILLCVINAQAVNVTFRLDLSALPLAVTPEVNGTFNNWCGNCNAMTDANGDNIWETTIDLSPGYYEYKFSYNNWQGQESLAVGSSCTNTTGSFTNRTVNVTSSIVLPIVCWNSCEACIDTPVTEWELCWSDEFNGNTLDPTIWTQEIGGWGWGNNEWQYYTNSANNLDISNGTLKIHARQESFAGSNYTSARIITNDKFEFQYGKVEARLKIPMGQGIWPAFWMLGANIESVSWPQCGEIDIMEHVNNEMQTHSTMHWNNGGHAYTGTSTPVSPNEFHNYGVIWDENKALFYVDDVFFYQYEYVNHANSQPIFTKPFFLLLNVAVGGNWPGYPDGTTTFPATMEVDYVRIYKEVQEGFECGVPIIIDEGPFLANDDFENASAVVPQTFPFCSMMNVDLSQASPSPESSSIAAVGAGQDAWYQCIATSQAMRVMATSPNGDIAIELHDAWGNLIQAADEANGGQEMLLAGNLVLGGLYKIVFKNMNPTDAGIVNFCIQTLQMSAPDNGISFNNLCHFIKCDWNGAQLYTVTFDDGLNTISASSSSTIIPFQSLNGLQYGTSYNVTFTSTFIQNDAGGNSTTAVVTSPPYPITIGEHVLVALRPSDRCPQQRNLGAFIGTDRIVCGATHYQWEMVACDQNGQPLGEEAVFYTSPNLSRYMRVSSIPNVQWGDFYLVRVRPLFAYGAGEWATEAQLLCVTPSSNLPLADRALSETMESKSVNGDLHIFPNPNNGSAFSIITNDTETEGGLLRIYDATGRLVQEERVVIAPRTQQELVLKNKLRAGMYTIELSLGDKRGIEKLIVE